MQSANTNSDEMQTKSMNYQALHSMTVKMVQTQQQTIERQQAQIDAEISIANASQVKAPFVVEEEISEDMDEKTRRRLTRQRVSAEIQSQRIREMAEKDPQVVAMVIRQWLGKSQ